MNDVYVYLVELPNGVSEMTMPCLDGGYTIYIDPRLSHQGRVKAYLHAMQHIEKCDWEKENIQEIEFEAHQP